jgi:hypothetical protein
MDLVVDAALEPSSLHDTVAVGAEPIEPLLYYAREIRAVSRTISIYSPFLTC